MGRKRAIPVKPKIILGTTPTAGKKTKTLDRRIVAKIFTSYSPFVLVHKVS